MMPIRRFILRLLLLFRTGAAEAELSREHQRDARGFRWLDNSRLDVKLGVRMLASTLRCR